MKFLKFLTVGLTLIVMTGCSTYATNRYSISADSVVALKQYKDNEVGVGIFTATKPGQKSIMCRGVGPIKTPDGETFEGFVRKALISEMKMAEAYTENGKVILSGVLNRIDFNSNSGDWDISLTVTSSNGKSLTIEEKYDYTTSFYGETACNQTAQALMPAVQNVIIKLVSHESFSSLVNGI
ncbi:MAG: hypothetical protein OQL17_00530 [Sedimenticola sp.]|nr:hypothetical protein [Sedimenticola sp.]MCW8948435.1 hypothetical protein [Sedimenticola sp.]